MNKKKRRTMPDLLPVNNGPHAGYTLHVDETGSWLEVPLSVLALMDLSPAIFSQYSYHAGGCVMFLEEFGDSGIFIKRYEYLYGHKPSLAGIVDHGKEAGYIRTMQKNTNGTSVSVH